MPILDETCWQCVYLKCGLFSLKSRSGDRIEFGEAQRNWRLDLLDARSSESINPLIYKNK